MVKLIFEETLYTGGRIPTTYTMSTPTAAQIDALLNFLEEHRDLARGNLRSIEGRTLSHRLWGEICDTLNAMGGCSKTTKQWQKVWTDKKYLAKKAAVAARRSASATGGGPATAPSLTQWEIKVISIMGDGFGEPQTTARIPAFIENTTETTTAASTQSYQEDLLNQMILVALNFYARGSYQGSVGQNNDAPMAQQTVSRCIREVSLAINSPEILRKYIKFPQNASERNAIKRKFYAKYNIPGVIGCIDCTHVAIVRPSQHEERFFNRKHFHSINTQVICDSDCVILNVDASYGGATHDSFIWSQSEIKAHLESLTETTYLLGPMHGKKVVCYVASWAAYRKLHGQFTIEDLDPSLCTHLIYSFAGLDETKNSIKSLDPWQDLEKDYGKAGFKRIVSLKERYPHLKVTIAIGGWNEGSPKYSKMASEPESREAFIKSVLVFLRQYNFDGLDLDWEYPTKRDGKPYDKANFVLLVKELKEAFEPHDYILTAALGAGKSTMESAYDLAKLSRHLDFLHMMAYDYHGTWDGFVGANAPLKGTDDLDVLSLEYTVSYMIEQGVSPYKLVLGLPFYGRTFILNNPDERRIEFGRTPVMSKGFKGPYTGEDGFMGYNEICMEISNKTSPWAHYWDERSGTPYLRDGARIISYDNARSIAMKVKMAVDRGLGGLMVWSVDTDDFRGLCAEEPEPFIDFIDRYNKIADQPLLKEALKTLNLPDAHATGSLSKGVAYVISEEKLTLRLPLRKPGSNYNLLRTINEATSLAMQEKRIMDEMSRVERENEINDNDDGPGGASAMVVSSLVVVLMCLFVSL